MSVDKVHPHQLYNPFNNDIYKYLSVQHGIYPFHIKQLCHSNHQLVVVFRAAQYVVKIRFHNIW